MRIDLVRSSQPIFEASLEPPDDLRERSGPENEVAINILFSKRNRVAVYDISIRKITEAVDEEVLDRLKLKWSEMPLLLAVCTHLGCLPDHNCKFTWLRAGFDLGREIPNRGLRPVACRLYPEDSKDPIKVVKSFEVSSKLGFKLLEVETPKFSGKATSQKQYESYQYQVATVGRMGPSPAWDFRVTDVHPEIVGDFTLIMLVAVKPGVNTKGEISISAQARLRSGLVDIPLITKRTTEGAIKNTFTLSGSLK